MWPSIPSFHSFIPHLLIFYRVSGLMLSLRHTVVNHPDFLIFQTVIGEIEASSSPLGEVSSWYLKKNTFLRIPWAVEWFLFVWNHIPGFPKSHSSHRSVTEVSIGLEAKPVSRVTVPCCSRIQFSIRLVTVHSPLCGGECQEVGARAPQSRSQVQHAKSQEHTRANSFV